MHYYWSLKGSTPTPVEGLFKGSFEVPFGVWNGFWSGVLKFYLKGLHRRVWVGFRNQGRRQQQLWGCGEALRKALVGGCSAISVHAAP